MKLNLSLFALLIIGIIILFSTWYSASVYKECRNTGAKIGYCLKVLIGDAK